jgi:hypothetical protein
MTVGWQPITNPLSSECGICKEALDHDVIAHNHEGIKHPFHKRCVVAWLKKNTSCPYCRVPTEATPLFSWQERMVNGLKKYKYTFQLEVIFVIAMGIFLGALCRSYPSSQRNVLVFRAVEISLFRLSMATMPATLAGLTAAYLIRLERCLAAILASMATSYYLY